MRNARDQRPSKGGLARRDKLSPEKRREIAVRAAQARWASTHEGTTVSLSELGVQMSSDVLAAADMLVGELEAQAAEWRQVGASALEQGDLARARVTIELIEQSRAIESRARALKLDVGTLFKSVSEDSAKKLLERPVAFNSTVDEARRQDRTDPAQLNTKRNQILRSLEMKLGAKFRKRTSATFVDEDADVRVVCTMSKWYPQNGTYWYAFHSHQDTFLEDASRGFFVLGMMDLDVAVVLPLDTIRQTMKELSTTEPLGGNAYWHLNVSRRPDGKLMLHRARGNDPLPLNQFVLPL